MAETDAHAKRRRLRRWVKISGVALLLAFVGLLISAVVSTREAHSVRLATAERGVLFRYDTKLRTILTLLIDAETGQRGYLLTGKDAYLAPYRNALLKVPTTLDSLEPAPLADRALIEHMRTIRRLSSAKLAELAETIRLRDAGKYSAALALVQSDVGEHSMSQIRREIADSISIGQAAIDADDARVVQATLWGQRLEGITLGALLFCGLFAAVQMGSLWVAQGRYEVALSASERLHRAIVEDQTELIAISQADGRLEFVNSAYAQFFGFAAADLAGRTLYDFLRTQEREEWQERMARVLSTDDCLLRVQLMPGKGKVGPRWISWRHRAQRTPGGATRIHSVGRDITVNKKAELELRDHENFLTRIGRVAGVGGWSIDLRSNVMYWSADVRKIHGVSEHYQPTPEKALGFFPARAQVVLRQAMDAAIEQHEQYDLELPLVTAAGTPIWVRAVGEAELDEDGRAIRLVGALQDITDRKNSERSLRELTQVFDGTPDFVAQTDWRGFVTYLNPAARRAVGIEPAESITGRTFAEFYTAETNQQFAREIVPAVKSFGVWVGESQVVLEGGRIAPISHMVIGHLDAVGRVSRYTSLMRDISAEVRGRQELARKTLTLNAIVEAIPAILAVWDGGVRYQLVNRAFERWRGSERERFVGYTMEQAMGTDEFKRCVPWIERALGGETVVYERDYPDARDCRHMSVTYTPLRLEDGSVGGFIELRQDITKSREERLRLVGLSEHDPLTGLLNRAGFESYLIEKMNRGEGGTLAVLYIDLDHFKPVNDRHGHAAGDDLLRQFSARLKAAVRPTDAVARLGGDEFAIVLMGVREATHIATVADKVIEAASTPYEVGGHTLRISASVGAAHNAELAGGWKGLVARADAKAYEAKAAGRGRRVLSDFGGTVTSKVSDRQAG
jgi:diguanylate cyclase (GGDEF)-like protein/PAS domain S-box-containing protein